jgi:ATP-dependent protease HslVU (ClpYQ) peptidase subunit
MIRPIPESEVIQLVFHGTTILALRHKEKVIVAGDGQVTLNATIVKHRAKKSQADL